MNDYNDNQFIFFDFCIPLLEQRITEMVPISCNGCQMKTNRKTSCLTSCGHSLCYSCQQQYKAECPSCNTKDYVICLD